MPIKEVAFFGPWAHESGLGAASRGGLRALWSLGDHYRVEAFAPKHWGPHQRYGPVDHVNLGTSNTQNLAKSGNSLAWLHMNPDATCASLSDEQKQLLGQFRYAVATWVWETQQVPASWHKAFNWIDQLWVPSQYCLDIFKPYTEKPVIVIPHVVDVPERVVNCKERVILYIFDGASYLIRKNPLALVRSFRASRLAAKGWRLVLKTKNLDLAGADTDSLQELYQCIAELKSQWPNQINLINQSLSASAVNQLLDTAAIYVSPHSSEGFGLTIAEALARGALVVATDYGGSRDILNHQNGFPVSYRLHHVEAGYGAYREGSTWARVSEEHLTESLLQAASVYEDTCQAEQKRRLARSMILNHCSVAAVAQRIHNALKYLN